MVSGFLISPYDQDRIFSGDAIEIRIWSKTWAGVVGLKRFIISWFIVFSSRADRHRQQIRNSFLARAPLNVREERECPADLREDMLRAPGRTWNLQALLSRLGRRGAHLGIVQVDVEAER